MDASDGGRKNGNGHPDPTPVSLPSDTAAPTGAPVSGAPPAPAAGAPAEQVPLVVVDRDESGRIKPGKSLNPKGRPAGAPSLNAQLVKAVKQFKIGNKGFLELFLTRSLQDVEYAKLIAPKIFANVDQPASQGGININNSNQQTTYENFISQLRAERAALVRPGMEDLDG